MTVEVKETGGKEEVGKNITADEVGKDEGK